MSKIETEREHYIGRKKLESGLMNITTDLIVRGSGSIRVKRRLEHVLEVARSLNEQQQNMVIGWLGKGRVKHIFPALVKIEDRIQKDNQQGRKSNKPVQGDHVDYGGDLVDPTSPTGRP